MDPHSSSKGEHYNLRWNNYTANLIQVFSEHQHHETLVDVTLTCEGQFIKAHKLILSACSGFFEDMFKIHNTVQHPIIVLNGIKFGHLKHILEFIYHGEVKILDEDLEGVLALGESFQIKGLSSVKIKHQMPMPDQHSARPSPDPLNIVHSTPNILTNQQKENIQEHPHSQEKLKEQISRSVRRIQVIEPHRIENAQSRVGVLNGKDAIEPVQIKSRTPEVTKVPTSNTESRIGSVSKETVEDQEKIPRATNAFMIFANEWRKKLAVEHPDENNKSISVMLGNMWKSLSTETKEFYYFAARKAQIEHEMKYPGCTDDSRESRKRKIAVRRKTIDCSTRMAFVDMQECKPNVDEDLEVIEIQEDPIDISDVKKPTSS